MSPIEQYNKMFTIVANAHTGQMYGDQPYLYHLNQVDKLVTQVNSQKQIVQCIGLTGCGQTYPDVVWFLKTSALGHDLLEDTHWTQDNLYDEGFNDLIVSTIVSITKQPDECKERYLLRLCKNPWAVLVKKADSFANLQNCLAEGRTGGILKYTENLQILTGGNNE